MGARTPRASHGSGSSLSLQVGAAAPYGRAVGPGPGMCRGQNSPGSVLGRVPLQGLLWAARPARERLLGRRSLPTTSCHQPDLHLLPSLHGKATSALDHTSAISALTTPAASTQKHKWNANTCGIPPGASLTHIQGPE